LKPEADIKRERNISAIRAVRIITPSNPRDIPVPIVYITVRGRGRVRFCPTVVIIVPMTNTSA
jgi:hypothetical protein